MRKIKDIQGNKYGRLTVISFVGTKNKKARWLCKCDCGNIVEVYGVDLRGANTKSCGCLRHQGRQSLHHNLIKTRIYGIWTGMKQRCYDINAKQYKDYGGRGITICDEWKNDFMTFYDWSIGNRYNDTLTIDRINNDGSYCPENCRWTTHKKQMSNTRRNLIYTIDGETLCLSEWCEKYNMPYWTVLHRIHRGVDVKTALTKPIDITRRNKLYKERK